MDLVTEIAVELYPLLFNFLKDQKLNKTLHAFKKESNIVKQFSISKILYSFHYFSQKELILMKV